MTEKPPLFGRQLREDLYRKRVLVLDGALDDDNGAVLMAQLLTLGSESDDDVALWIHSPAVRCPPCWRSAT